MLTRDVFPVPADWQLSPLQLTLLRCLMGGKYMTVAEITDGLNAQHGRAKYSNRRISQIISYINAKIRPHGYEVSTLAHVGYHLSVRRTAVNRIWA